MVIDAFFSVAVPVLTGAVILGAVVKGRLPSQPAPGTSNATFKHKTASIVILLFFMGIHAVMILEFARHFRDPAFRVIVSVLLALPVYTVCALVVGLYSFIAHLINRGKTPQG